MPASPSPTTCSTRSTPSSAQVAEALRGPVRVLAGAGTGKTRAITHRIAYGVATGVYDPTEVLAVTFTTRAAGEMRSRLRALGAGGVQARTFHSAALRQLRYFWPQVYGGELPELDRVQARPARRRRPPQPASRPTRRCCATWPARSSGPRSATSAPTTTPRVAAGPRPRGHRPRRRRPWRASSPAYEEVKRDQGRMDMEDVLLLRRRRCSPRTSGSPPRSAGSTSGSSSTSSRTSRPIQSALLDLWLGGRDELCVVGDPAQTIYSFAGANAAYLRDFPHEVPRHHRRSSWSATTAPRPEVVEAANTAARRHRQPRRRSCAPSSPAGPDGHATREHPDEVAEAEAVAAEIARLRDAGRAAARDRGAVPDQRPVRGLRGGARRPRHPLRRPRRGPVLRPPRGARRRSPCCAATARGRRGRRRRLVEHVARRARRDGLDRPRRPTGRGQARDRWESLQALVDPGRRSSPPRSPAPTLGDFVAELDRRAAEQHAPVADGVTLATLHAAKGLEWDAVFLCGHAGGHAADHLRRHPGRGRGGAPAALRRHHPGPAATSRSPGRWPATPAAGRRASRRGSSTGLRPETRLGRARPTRRAAPQAQGVAHCRECGKPLARPAREEASAAATTARRPTTRSCSSGCAPGAWSGPAQESVPAFVVFTDATLQAIAEVKPRRPRRPCCGSTASASPSSTKYGDDVLALRRLRCGDSADDASMVRELFEKYPENRLPLTGRARYVSPSHDHAHHGPDKAGARQHRRRWSQ